MQFGLMTLALLSPSSAVHQNFCDFEQTN